MPLDPNILLGLKPIQIDDPVETQNKILSMRGMQNRLQMENQDLQDRQSLKDAFRQNVVTNPDGTRSLNMKGVIDSQYAVNPMKAHELQTQQTQTDLADSQAKMKAFQDKVGYIHDSLGQVTDDATYQAHLQRMAQAGIPNPPNAPAHFDPNWTKATFASTTDAKTKLEQQSKLIDQQNSRAQANAALAEAGQPMLPTLGGMPKQSASGNALSGSAPGGGGFTPPPKMQQKAMADYNSAIAGSRQQADATQALKDIQASQKLSAIANHAPGGDLNKLNNQQMKLAITEVVKMAGGSVPTEGELEQMTPDNYAQKYAGVLQKLTNKSQPANAGEFLKQAIDYGNSIQGLGAKKLAKRANEFADRQRPYLGEQQYKMVKAQIEDELKGNLPAAGGGGKPQTVIQNGHTYTLNPSTGEYE